jgi:hypothetical protein
MGFTIRVSTPGNDALTDTNRDHYALYADEDNILIKEERRGTINNDFNEIATISHNLDYIPMFLVYSETTTGRYRINNAFDVVGGGWRAYAGTADLTIENRYDDNKTSRYYIFYDNVGSAV